MSRACARLFFNEAHAAGVLEHPNILRIYDADMDGPLCYLVLEYVAEGGTLRPFCASENLLPPAEVASAMYKCAKALDYAHDQGVIHRDVKPSNILYTADHYVKLADFSIAMVNRADLDMTQLTGFLGSPLYMSPEQIKGETLTCNSDLFSLGVVTYEMLTGHHPFRAKGLPALTENIVTIDPPPLSTFRPDLSSELNEVVQHMLAKDPKKRHQNGRSVAADLATVFENVDVSSDTGDLQQHYRALRGFGFFKRLTDGDLWELTRTCAWERHAAGTKIITEGESDHSFYLILSGVVTVEKNANSVTTLLAGDCFGEMGYLSKAKRTASVIAKIEVALIKVNSDSINCADEGAQLRFHKAFVQTLIERLTDTTSSVSQL